MILAQMMQMPLRISSLIRHADRYHGDTEIVSCLTEGGTHRYTYTDAHRRARQLARALGSLGVRPGERIGVEGDTQRVAPSLNAGSPSSTRRGMALRATQNFSQNGCRSTTACSPGWSCPTSVNGLVSQSVPSHTRKVTGSKPVGTTT
jgi:hypothetical protein